MNRKSILILSEVLFASVTVFLLATDMWFYEGTHQGAMPFVLASYPIFAMILLFSFNHKFGIQQLTRSLALCLMITYLLTELHEIPAFIQAYLGAFDETRIIREWFVWYTPLSHAYTIIVGYLTLKLARLQSWKMPILLATIMLIGLFFIEPIDQFIIRRAFTFAFIYAIFYIWSKPTDER